MPAGRGDPPVTAATLVNAVSALALVLGLIAAAGWAAARRPAFMAAVMRRASGLRPAGTGTGTAATPGPPPPLRLRATLALDRTRRLHIIDAEAGAVLILTGGPQDHIIPWPRA